MAKTTKKSVFFCKECGYESSKWLGQCPSCKAWDSFTEERVSQVKGHDSYILKKNTKPLKLSQVNIENQERTLTNIGELDRVLGGGIVAGSMILVGGDPGIGKSTLLLQMCRNLSEGGKSVLYVSGEESARQIKMRADRLPAFNNEMLILSETDIEVVVSHINDIKPDVVIIDSIQTMLSTELGQAPGSVAQIREATGVFLKLAKTLPVSIFLVGHVTKEGVVAGPRVLEHMVDTVLYFENESGAAYRFLRAVKNRFGSTNEVGVFEMQGDGLHEVKNASEYMLAGRPEGEAGSVVSCSLEGTRPILVEIQALCARTSFNLPRRTATGTDFNRLNLLLAVIEKRIGIYVGELDVYINIAGGLRITEPAMDLAIIGAIISSCKDKEVDKKTIMFGEVGLVGEIRAVNMAEKRVSEAAKLGFSLCIMPQVNIDSLMLEKSELKDMKLVGISNVKELFRLL